MASFWTGSGITASTGGSAVESIGARGGVLESLASEALPGVKLDHSVYPDLERPPLAPADLATIEDQADYLHRVCAQQDTGLATLKP